MLKHAGTGAEVTLTVHRDDDAVLVTLADDGPAAPAKPGHGLIGMRERVELVGGSLRAEPTGRG